MEFCTRVSTQLILNHIKEYEESGENLVFSPLSLNCMLNLTASGATGRTREQYLSLLKSETLSDLNDHSSRMIALAKSDDNDNEGPLLLFANRAWVNDEYVLKPSYQQLAEQVYGADVRVVDFRFERGEPVREEVNLWVTNATKGLIRNLLPSGHFDRERLPVLVKANALYFKGHWKQTFNRNYTRDEDFHLLNGTSITVPYMTRYDEHQFFAQFPDFKLLKLPYQHGRKSGNKRFSMYLFLPNQKNGYTSLIPTLISDQWVLQNSDLKLERVELSKLWIPKLKFSHEFEASNILKQMGLTLPFDPDLAELTEIADNPNLAVVGEETKLYVSMLLHKSFIEVSEEGTEAAACTEESDDECGCSLYYEPPPPRPTFVADHPFMFMIKEDVSGMVFFTGAVLNPSKC